jgi:hypothetical protein
MPGAIFLHAVSTGLRKVEGGMTHHAISSTDYRRHTRAREGPKRIWNQRRLSTGAYGKGRPACGAPSRPTSSRGSRLTAVESTRIHAEENHIHRLGSSAGKPLRLIVSLGSATCARLEGRASVRGSCGPFFFCRLGEHQPRLSLRHDVGLGGPLDYLHVPGLAGVGGQCLRLVAVVLDLAHV